MSKERAVNYKIRVKDKEIEVEVVGINSRETKNMFDELAKKYLGK